MKKPRHAAAFWSEISSDIRKNLLSFQFIPSLEDEDDSGADEQDDPRYDFSGIILIEVIIVSLCVQGSSKNK